MRAPDSDARWTGSMAKKADDVETFSPHQQKGDT